MSRLIFICKRKPQQRDLVERPYGRFHHLPRMMAAAGHQIHLALISHGDDGKVEVSRDGFDISSHGIGDIRTLMSPAKIASLFGGQSPDWIIGCSDAWVGVLAARLARRTGARLALDAYDDYETYMPWNLPLHALWRMALKRADVVTAAGPQLGALLDRSRAGRPPAVVVPMAADPAFRPMPRDAARRSLGLTLDTPLIGYSGGWAAKRGTELLVPMLREVRRRRPEVQLLLTGRPPEHVLSEPGVLSLGYVADDALPAVMSASEVIAVVTTTSGFGNYSYPAKLYEAMACARPLVATSTDPVRWILRGAEDLLVPPGDPQAFANAVLGQLDAGTREFRGLGSWEDSAQTMASSLLATLNPPQ